MEITVFHRDDGIYLIVPSSLKINDDDITQIGYVDLMGKPRKMIKVGIKSFDDVVEEVKTENPNLNDDEITEISRKIYYKNVDDAITKVAEIIVSTVSRLNP